MEVAEWLRHKVLSLGGPWFELRLAFFYTIFLHIFQPAVTVLSEYLNRNFAVGSCVLLYNPLKAL